MSKINTGDTVKLRSGSPIMTIAEVKASTAICIWWTYGDSGYIGEPKTAELPIKALKAWPIEERGRR